jgi:hypothetical protein
MNQNNPTYSRVSRVASTVTILEIIDNFRDCLDRQLEIDRE